MKLILVYIAVFLLFLVVGIFLSSPILKLIKGKQLLQTGCIVLTPEEFSKLSQIELANLPCVQTICEDDSCLKNILRGNN